MIIFYYLIFFVSTAFHPASLSPWSEKPLSRQAVSKNAFSKATEAVQKGDFLNALKNWYPQLLDHDREVLLSFIFQHKTPKDLSRDEMKLFEEKAVALRKIFPDFASPLIIAIEWKGALPSLFPPIAVKVIPLAEEERKKAEVAPQKKYTHKITVFEHEQPTYAPLTLTSSEGIEVPIPRKVAQNCLVSKMLCTTLELDSKASNIKIKFPTSTLKRIVYLMKNLDQLLRQRHFETPLTLLQQKELVGIIFTKYLQIKSENIDTITLSSLLQAAHYFDSPILESAFARNYARYLISLKNPGEDLHVRIMEEVEHHQLPIPLLRTISKEAFLVYNEDLDFELGNIKTNISFNELTLWNKFPAQLLKTFPNLGTNPNEARDTLHGKINVLGYLSLHPDPLVATALTKLKDIDLKSYQITLPSSPHDRDNPNDTNVIKTLLALIRGGVEIEADNLLAMAAASGTTDMIGMAVGLGANINAKDKNGETPLMLAVSHDMLENTAAILKFYPDTTLVDSQGRTALIISLQKNPINYEIVKLLLPHMDMKLEEEIMNKQQMNHQLDMIHRYIQTGKFE